jgi:hypothetical protein
MGSKHRSYWFYTKEKVVSVKTVRTLENIAVVRDAIERSPHRLARRHSVSLWLSEASVRRILHKHLLFYPYKIQVTHELHERGYVNRVNSCGETSTSDSRKRLTECIERNWRHLNDIIFGK